MINHPCVSFPSWFAMANLKDAWAMNMWEELGGEGH